MFGSLLLSILMILTVHHAGGADYMYFHLYTYVASNLHTQLLKILLFALFNTL